VAYPREEALAVLEGAYLAEEDVVAASYQESFQGVEVEVVAYQGQMPQEVAYQDCFVVEASQV